MWKHFHKLQLFTILFLFVSDVWCSVLFVIEAEEAPQNKKKKRIRNQEKNIQRIILYLGYFGKKKRGENSHRHHIPRILAGMYWSVTSCRSTMRWYQYIQLYWKMYVKFSFQWIPFIIYCFIQIRLRRDELEHMLTCCFIFSTILYLRHC